MCNKTTLQQASLFIRNDTKFLGKLCTAQNFPLLLKHTNENIKSMLFSITNIVMEILKICYLLSLLMLSPCSLQQVKC